jgi:hypothetical protein
MNLLVLQGSQGDVRLCDHWVPDSCLAERSADACIVGLIDYLTAAPTVVAATESHTSGGSGAPIIMVAVPVAVVGKQCRILWQHWQISQMVWWGCAADLLD